MKDLIRAVNAAISRGLALSEEHIYNHSVMQDLHLPAAFVQVHSINSQARLADASTHRVHFHISYVKEEAEADHASLLMASDDLYYVLHRLIYDDGREKLARNLDFDIDDEHVLHCDVSYDVHVSRKPSGEHVEHLEIEQESKRKGDE